MREKGKTIGVVFDADDLGSVMPGKPVRLPPRPPPLAGRDDLLTDLDIRLAKGNVAGPQIVVLHGLPGGGKASVAVEYAHRHLGEVGVAWRFPAEDATVLAAGFTDLAGQLGIGEAGGGSDPVASVQSALAEYPGGWLLIFDNAPGPELVREVLPPAGNGRALITSRNALWPASETVEVPVLDVDAAAGFLVDRAGDPDERAARALTEDLGGLPLALEQAAAYTQANGGSLAGYLALFQRRRGDLPTRTEASGYPAAVATTCALAFDHLEQSAPPAIGLLRLLAHYAPEAVPLQLLLQPQPGLTIDLAPAVAEALAPLLEDERAAVDAVAALREHSLVRPALFGAVSVHRLVQTVTVGQMPAELARAWRQAAAALVEAALPEDPQDPADRPAFATLLSHARAVLDLTSDGAWQIAAYLGHSGSHPAARDLFRQIAGAYHEDDVFGPDHADTLAARHELAHWTGEAGDAAGARDQFAALLPMIERVLGPVHPDTLTTRSNLATWTGEAGDAAGARDQFPALLSIEERVSGPEHPNTQATRRKLAQWAEQARDAARARNQNATLAAIEEPESGPGHPDTLAARHELAHWTGQAEAEAACDQDAAPAPIEERAPAPQHPDTPPPTDEPAPSPEHPDTLTTCSNLAAQAGEAGDAAGARDHIAALLPVIERVLGPVHPDTLAARHGFATGPGRRETRPGPATSTTSCCPSRTGCTAPSTPAPWPPSTSSPTGPGKRGTRPGPATSTPPCCSSRRGCMAPSTPVP
jgi:hypothetical protein